MGDGDIHIQASIVQQQKPTSFAKKMMKGSSEGRVYVKLTGTNDESNKVFEKTIKGIVPKSEKQLESMMNKQKYVLITDDTGTQLLVKSKDLNKLGVNVLNEESNEEQNFIEETSDIEAPPKELTFEEKKQELLDKIGRESRTTERPLLMSASDEFKSDPEVVTKSVERNGLSLKFASSELKNNKEIVLIAVKQNPEALKFASDELKNDRDVVMAAVKKSTLALEFASEELKNDLDVVFVVLGREPEHSFQHTGKEFQKNWNNALESIKNSDKESCKALFDGLDPRFKRNEFFMLKAIKNNYMAANFLGDNLKRSESFMARVVKEDWRTLEFAEGFKDDDEFIRLGIRQDGNALQFAEDYTFSEDSEDSEDDDIVSDEGRYQSTGPNDKEGIVTYATKKNVEALQFASDRLLDDDNFMFKTFMGTSIKGFSSNVIVPDITVIKYASDRLKNDKDFMLRAIKQDFNAIKYASKELMNDKDFMLKIFSTTGKTAFQISNSTVVLQKYAERFEKYAGGFKSDPDVVLAAIKLNPMVLQYASEDLKNNKKIVLEAVKRNPLAIQFASNELKNDKEIVSTAVKKNGLTLQFAGEDLKNDLLVVSDAFDQNSKAIQFAGNDVMTNKQQMRSFIMRNYRALEFMSKDLRNNREFIDFAVNEYINKYSATSMPKEDFINMIGDDLKKDAPFIDAVNAKLSKLR